VLGRSLGSLGANPSEVGRACSLLGSRQTEQPGGVVTKRLEGFHGAGCVTIRLDEDGRARAS
jgi:hypothetical protein